MGCAATMRLFESKCEVARSPSLMNLKNLMNSNPALAASGRICCGKGFAGVVPPRRDSGATRL